MSYDNDNLFITKLYGDVTSLALDVRNINASMSPLLTSIDDMAFIVDTSAGSVTLNINTSNNLIDNQSYIIKKDDASPNPVIIVPPPGETIDGAASLSIIGENRVVQIVKNESNWEIINNSYDLNVLFGAKGSLLTSNGTTAAILPVGPNGYVLMADSTAANGIKWSATGGGGEVNDGANVGVGTGSVYKNKTGVDLNFRTLLAGSGISISTGTNEVTISASGSTYETITSSVPVNINPDVELTQLNINTGTNSIITISLGTPASPIIGRRKTIILIAKSGNDTFRVLVSPFVAGSSIDFPLLGMSITLLWTSNGWANASSGVLVS